MPFRSLDNPLCLSRYISTKPEKSKPSHKIRIYLSRSRQYPVFAIIIVKDAAYPGSWCMRWSRWVSGCIVSLLPSCLLQSCCLGKAMPLAISLGSIIKIVITLSEPGSTVSIRVRSSLSWRFLVGRRRMLLRLRLPLLL